MKIDEISGFSKWKLEDLAVAGAQIAVWGRLVSLQLRLNVGSQWVGFHLNVFFEASTLRVVPLRTPW